MQGLSEALVKRVFDFRVHCWPVRVAPASGLDAEAQPAGLLAAVEQLNWLLAAGAVLQLSGGWVWSEGFGQAVAAAYKDSSLKLEVCSCVRTQSLERNLARQARWDCLACTHGTAAGQQFRAT